MTVTTLEPTVVETTAPEDQYDHIVCHCTGGNISWCGLDVSDAPFVDKLDDEQSCLFCDLVEDMDRGRCPWGCTCTDAEREFHCGYSVEELL